MKHAPFQSVRIGRALLLGGAALALLALGTWIVRFPLPEAGPMEIEVVEGALGSVRGMTLDDVRVTEWNDGAAQWSISAASAEFRDDAQQVVFYLPRLETSVDRLNSVEVWGELGVARLLEGEDRRFQVRDVHISENVSATNEKGMRIETSEMVWDSTSEAFWCPQPCVIHGPDGQVYQADSGHLTPTNFNGRRFRLMRAADS